MPNVVKPMSNFQITLHELHNYITQPRTGRSTLTAGVFLFYLDLFPGAFRLLQQIGKTVPFAFASIFIVFPIKSSIYVNFSKDLKHIFNSGVW